MIAPGGSAFGGERVHRFQADDQLPADHRVDNA